MIRFRKVILFKGKDHFDKGFFGNLGPAGPIRKVILFKGFGAQKSYFVKGFRAPGKSFVEGFWARARPAENP